MKLAQLLLLFFLVGCQSNDSHKVLGVYKDQEKSTIIIKKFGEALQVTYYKVSGFKAKKSIFPATYESGIIKFNYDGLNYSAVYDDNKLLLNNSIYVRFATESDMTIVTNIQELCDLVVKAYKIEAPEIINTVYIEPENSLGQTSPCATRWGHSDPEEEKLRYFNKLQGQFKNLKFVEYKTRDRRHADDNSYVDENNCKQNFKEIVDVAIKCSLNNQNYYFKLEKVGISNDNKIYILDPNWDRSNVPHDDDEKMFVNFDKLENDPFKPKAIDYSVARDSVFMPDSIAY